MYKQGKEVMVAYRSIGKGVDVLVDRSVPMEKRGMIGRGPLAVDEL